MHYPDHAASQDPRVTSARTLQNKLDAFSELAPYLTGQFPAISTDAAQQEQARKKVMDTLAAQDHEVGLV